MATHHLKDLESLTPLLNYCLVVDWQLERIAHAQSEQIWASWKTLHIFLCPTAPNDVSFAATFFYILCSWTLMALVIVQRSPTPSTTSSPCVSVSLLSILPVFLYLLNDLISMSELQRQF